MLIRMKIYLLVLIASIFIIPSAGGLAVAQTTCPADQSYDNNTKMCVTCWEVGYLNAGVEGCNTPSNLFGTLMLPFERIFGGLTIVIMWGLMVSIIWLRTQNPMLVGVLGIAMTAGYMTVAPEAPSNEFDGARLIGGALFAISLGISIYHLINTRLFQPPQ